MAMLLMEGCCVDDNATATAMLLLLLLVGYKRSVLTATATAMLMVFMSHPPTYPNLLRLTH